MTWLLFVACLANLVALGNSLSLRDAARDSHLELHLLGKLVAFGDSLSDNGTGAWTASNHTWPADPAYYGHRFSNGPVWVENLAKSLTMNLEDSAVGGATSNNSVTQGFTGFNSTIPVHSVLEQANAYVENGKIGSHDLFVLMVGANDAFFNGTVEAVVAAISTIVHQFKKKGATKFLLASYPDLGNLPLRAFSTAAATEELEKFSISLQTSLVELWHRLCQSHIQIGFVDIHSLFKDMMAHPSVYGFDPSKIGESCLVGAYGEAPRTLCNDPDRYIFWDEYHPTRVVHGHIGSLALNASQTLCNGRDFSQ